MLASELHKDGSTEDKLFAPGYGEFSTSDGRDVEALALAVPTDATTGSMPQELTTMSDGALSVFAAAGSGGWKAVTAAASDVVSAWNVVRSADVPSRIAPLLERAVDALDAAVDARSPDRARNAAIEAARLSFDLQLRYRPVTEIDLARMDLWAAQLLVDEAAGNTDGVAADAYAMDYVRDRIWAALDETDLARVNAALGAIQVAVVDGEPAAAAEAAGGLRDILKGLEPPG